MLVRRSVATGWREASHKPHAASPDAIRGTRAGMTPLNKRLSAWSKEFGNWRRMSTEQRALLATILVVAIFLGWQYFLPRPEEPPSPVKEAPLSKAAKPLTAKPAVATLPLASLQGRAASPKAQIGRAHV